MEGGFFFKCLFSPNPPLLSPQTNLLLIEQSKGLKKGVRVKRIFFFRCWCGGVEGRLRPACMVRHKAGRREFFSFIYLLGLERYQKSRLCSCRKSQNICRMIYFKPPPDGGFWFAYVVLAGSLADRRGVTHLHWSFSFCALCSTYIHCRDDALVGERVLLMMITVNDDGGF